MHRQAAKRAKREPQAVVYPPSVLDRLCNDVFLCITGGLRGRDLQSLCLTSQALSSSVYYPILQSTPNPMVQHLAVSLLWGMRPDVLPTKLRVESLKGLRCYPRLMMKAANKLFTPMCHCHLADFCRFVAAVSGEDPVTFLGHYNRHRWLREDEGTSTAPVVGPHRLGLTLYRQMAPVDKCPGAPVKPLKAFRRIR